MKLLLLPLLFSLFTPQAFAEDNESYDEIIAYAFERTAFFLTAFEIPKEKAIFCLGPNQLDEFYFEEGKEKKRVARYVSAFSIDDTKSVEDMLNQRVPLELKKRYELSIYRQTTKQTTVRIVGVGLDLFGSQFHLRAGDLIVIRPVKTDDK